jgi:hypothetical protein
MATAPRKELEMNTGFPVENFNELNIFQLYDPEPSKFFSYQLMNTATEQYSEEIFINQEHCTLLIFLGHERKEGGSGWMKHPEKHFKLLKHIIREAELPADFEFDFTTKPLIGKDFVPATWLWDPRNQKRKTTVSEINKKMRLAHEEKSGENISGNLILMPPDQKGSGIYSLNPHIKKVEIGYMF